MSVLYHLSDVKVTAGERNILSVDQLHLHDGEFVAVAGPNGAGKSTLLSVLSGLRKQFDGKCSYLGRDIHSWPRREFTRSVATVTQTRPVSFPFTVEEVVLMGRTPHASGWFESPDDLLAVQNALQQTGSLSLSGRDFRTLSGGEQQRVILAAALAQNPRVLLLDEPNSFLDLHHQIQLYKLLCELRDSGTLVVIITHDLNLAAAHATRLLLLQDGEIVADDRPETVITAETIRSVFRVEAELHRNRSGNVWVHYGL